MIRRLLFDWLTKLSFDWPSPGPIPATLSDDLQESLPNFALIFPPPFPFRFPSFLFLHILVSSLQPPTGFPQTADSLSMIMNSGPIGTADKVQEKIIQLSIARAVLVQSQLNQWQSNRLGSKHKGRSLPHSTSH